MELLTRILDAHERSVSFGRPEPWPRDVIIKFDARTFPDAFAPEGRQTREILVAAAAELADEGCVRLVRYGRGHLRNEPREVRLGPNEVGRAIEAARALGYEPLSATLAELEHHTVALSTQPQPAWMRTFLENLAVALRQADPSVLGFSRTRLKQERRTLVAALTAAVALSRDPAPAWERVTSERLFRDSKLLGRIRPLVVAVLVRADPRWQGVPPEEATELLEVYGVRRKPGLIRCAGAADLHVGGKTYALEDFAPVAHLPDTWSEAWVKALVSADVRCVTTIENEYPFLSYVEQANGPGGLASRGEIAVYTAGFPTPRLVTALSQLARQSSATFQHWGDADVGGLRIWYFLRSRLGCPLTIVRTTADWVASESQHGGRPLSSVERQALVRMRQELGDGEGPDLDIARALIESLLKHGVKLEQERY
jgi:Uncharacterized protein conserved in bacteria C-term(DUF2220)